MGSDDRTPSQSVFRWLWFSFVVVWVGAYLLLANLVWDLGGSRGLRAGLATAGVFATPMGLLLIFRWAKTLFRSPPGSDYGVPGQGSPYFVPPQSRLGPRGELFVRFWVGIGFLVVSVLKAAAPRPGHLPGDPSGNPGFWELIGFLTAVIGSAILSSALIKVRVLRDR
jgi:hypothetical protein